MHHPLAKVDGHLPETVGRCRRGREGLFLNAFMQRLHSTLAVMTSAPAPAYPLSLSSSIDHLRFCLPFLTAIPAAFPLPTSTTSLRPLVIPV